MLADLVSTVFVADPTQVILLECHSPYPSSKKLPLK